MTRVLVLEDDLTQLELRKMILEQAGYNVEAAATVEEAIERCGGCHAAVIDLVMGVEGFLENVPPGAAVIVLSGRESLPANLRVDRFLRKPCATALLLEAVAQVTRGHSG